MSGRFQVREIAGFCVKEDTLLGHLWVEHDGDVTWDELFHIKNFVWGEEAAAIEVYPPLGKLVNSKNIRHLFRLGATDFYPDLLGNDATHDSLEARQAVAWSEARR